MAVVAAADAPTGGGAAPEPTPVPNPPPPPPPEPERRFAAGVEALVGSGALPSLAPGFGLRLAAGGAALTAELRANVWLSRSTASRDVSTAGGNFDLMDVAAAGCARARHDQFLSPGLCVGASV